MKVRIERIKLNEPYQPNIWANISFSYDNRDNWIRSCQAEIDLNKHEITDLPSYEIEKFALRQVYNLLEEIIAKCERFSDFPVVTIEL